MKIINVVLFFLVGSFSWASGQSVKMRDLGSNLKCTWLDSSKNPAGFFVKNSSFTIVPISKTEALIKEDTFFNRTYTPCYTGGFESCMFAFSYDSKDVWRVEEGRLVQDWRFGSEHGTVYGSSKLTLLEDEATGVVEISGDDGDGVWFTEKFSCKAVK